MTEGFKFKKLSEFYWFMSLYNTKLSKLPDDRTKTNIWKEIFGLKRNQHQFSFLGEMISQGVLRQDGTVRLIGKVCPTYKIDRGRMEKLFESTELFKLFDNIYSNMKFVPF